MKVSIQQNRIDDEIMNDDSGVLPGKKQKITIGRKKFVTKKTVSNQKTNAASSLISGISGSNDGATSLFSASPYKGN